MKLLLNPGNKATCYALKKIVVNLNITCLFTFFRYRFMHSIGNPVDLSRPEIISQTQAFYQYAIVAKNVIDPTHHPCLESLPEIFLKAMQSVSSMVDAFIGISNESKSNQKISRSDSTQDIISPQGM